MMDQIENLKDKQRTNANSRHKAKAFSFNFTDLTQIAYKLNKKSWSIYVCLSYAFVQLNWLLTQH